MRRGRDVLPTVHLKFYELLNVLSLNYKWLLRILKMKDLQGRHNINPERAIASIVAFLFLFIALRKVQSIYHPYGLLLAQWDAAWIV